MKRVPGNVSHASPKRCEARRAISGIYATAHRNDSHFLNRDKNADIGFLPKSNAKGGNSWQANAAFYAASFTQMQLMTSSAYGKFWGPSMGWRYVGRMILLKKEAAGKTGGLRKMPRHPAWAPFQSHRGSIQTRQKHTKKRAKPPVGTAKSSSTSNPVIVSTRSTTKAPEPR